MYMRMCVPFFVLCVGAFESSPSITSPLITSPHIHQSSNPPRGLCPLTPPLSHLITPLPLHHPNPPPKTSGVRARDAADAARGGLAGPRRAYARAPGGSFNQEGREGGKEEGGLWMYACMHACVCVGACISFEVFREHLFIFTHSIIDDAFTHFDFPSPKPKPNNKLPSPPPTNHLNQPPLPTPHSLPPPPPSSLTIHHHPSPPLQRSGARPSTSTTAATRSSPPSPSPHTLQVNIFF